MKNSKGLVVAAVGLASFVSGCGLLSEREISYCTEGKPSSLAGMYIQEKMDKAGTEAAKTGGWISFYGADIMFEAVVCPDGDKMLQVQCLEKLTAQHNIRYVYRIEQGQVIPAWCAYLATPGFEGTFKKIDEVVLGIKNDMPIVTPMPQDRDMDGVLDADDQCPDEAQGATPDPNRRGCPYVAPIIPCSSAVRDMTDPTLVCVQGPSTLADPRSLSWNAPYAFDRTDSGTFVKKGTSRVYLGLIALTVVSGNVNVCNATGTCVTVPAAPNKIYTVGRTGDEVAVLRTGANVQVRKAYLRQDGQLESDPCTTLYMGETGSCLVENL